MPPVDLVPLGENTIRILLTTDNHVGYLENDPIRGDDSWKTFQEITSLAKQHDVDMILQGGDLFHVSKPSKKSLFHVVQLLRLNCLGDRPCELELLSDPSAALRMGETVNYEDPNLNVLVPVFAISGNHDDATGEGLLLPMDVLAATGLVNYFGQIPRLDRITVTPLVFQKGTTKLALYGINNLRDERLQRIMRNGDVTFQRPKSDSDFFHLLCLHQNHVRHSMTSYVPEEFLPSFLDFVLWGHEHECIPFPQYNPTTGFDTLQPGSSVATSLSEGETAPKHVFILDIHHREYAITLIPLQTVRPFLMRDVNLRDEGFVEGPASKSDVLSFLTRNVEELVAEAQALSQSQPELGNPLLPLIRLRVDHTGDYDVENSRRFSNRFVGKIANVNDVILYHKRKSNKLPAVDNKVLDQKSTAAPVTLNTSIQKILREFLGDSNLNLVPETGMFDATKKCIEQDDKQVLADYVEKTVLDAARMLLGINIDEEDFYLGDDTLVKRSFRQLLNQLRVNSKRKPIENIESLELSGTSMFEAEGGKDQRITQNRGNRPDRAARNQLKVKSIEKIDWSDDDEDLLNENGRDDYENNNSSLSTPKGTRRAKRKPRKDIKLSESEVEYLGSDFEEQEKPTKKARGSSGFPRVTKPSLNKTKKKKSLSENLDDLLSLG